MKSCLKCGKYIDENNDKEKWAMIITKKGQKIIDFSCFHFSCWRDFLEVNLRMLVGKV